MKTSMEQMRAWRGPGIFSYGFRPFFTGAALWAVAAMVIWASIISGILDVTAAFDPVTWHAHEFLFGYLGAVLAGFLLTAVPNWTGRLPIVGWPLIALFALWVLGRVVILSGEELGATVVAIADLLFPLTLIIVIAIEIVIGRNWRNLIVLAMVVVFVTGNAVFHWEAATDEYAPQGVGFRLGLGAAVMMIAVVGGRIIPSFTRNWLVKRGATSLPAPPMGIFDRIALAGLLCALVVWVAAPERSVTGILLAIAGALHIVRLLRWKGAGTFAEPLVLILHIGYLFLPLGSVSMAVAILFPEAMSIVAAQHLWMAGGLGVMTMAVMTRATLGHTGKALSAGPWTVMIYALVVFSVLVRVASGWYPAEALFLNELAGVAWIAGFAGFVVGYGPGLIRRKEN